MKTVIETGNGRDVVITHFPTAKKDSSNNIIWANEKDNIAKCKGRVTELKFFESIHMGDESTWTKVEMTAAEIKVLYNAVMEIEANESEQFID